MMATADEGQALVLVVEDDSDLRDSMVELLCDAGFSALGAGTGTEALDILRKRRPHVVLADLTLPGLDGQALMQEAQSMMDAAPAFVFVTGAVPPALGHLDAPIMTKPVDIDQLLRVVGKLVQTPLVEE